MQLFDQSWKDHLLHLDHLRQGIGLRAYGQKDPLNEYKREAFNLFNDLLTGLREQVVGLLADAAAAHGAAADAATCRRRCRRSTRIRRWPAGCSDDPAFDPADPDGGGVATLPRPRRRRKAAKRSQRSRDLGQGLAQRALPLRLRQEVQALPRPGLKHLSPRA